MMSFPLADWLIYRSIAYKSGGSYNAPQPRHPTFSFHNSLKLLTASNKKNNPVFMSSDTSLCVDCEKLPWDQLFKTDDPAARPPITMWRIPEVGKCQFCTMLRKM